MRRTAVVDGAIGGARHDVGRDTPDGGSRCRTGRDVTSGGWLTAIFFTALALTLAAWQHEPGIELNIYSLPADYPGYQSRECRVLSSYCASSAFSLLTVFCAIGSGPGRLERMKVKRGMRSRLGGGGGRYGMGRVKERVAEQIAT